MPFHAGSEPPEAPAVRTCCMLPFASYTNWPAAKALCGCQLAGPFSIHVTVPSVVVWPNAVFHCGGGPPDVPAVCTNWTLRLVSMMKSFTANAVFDCHCSNGAG